MRVIYAGSFSPPTLGHLDIIRRAAAMFDEVVVAVLSQSEKTYLFSLEKRREMLARVTDDLANVRVVADTGMLVELARREGADVIVRGLRGPDDLTFEMQMAEANRLIGGVETVFLTSRPEYGMISSTIVRDCASHGAPIDRMAPKEIIQQIYDVFGVSPAMERKV